MGKPSRAAADAAYRKNLEQLEGRAPVPPGVLPGQIDLLDGSIAGSTAHVETSAASAVRSCPGVPVQWIPDHCPECGRTMLIESGWALMKPREDRKIQCGNCGTILVVGQGAYDTLLLALKAHYDRLNYVPPKKERKARGAG